MKKHLLILVTFFISLLSFSQFTTGNLVVVRLGDGTALGAGAASRSFLDEYTITGTLVQTVPMPVTSSGGNRQFFINNSSPTEGLITTSLDGRYLFLMGYDVAEGSAPVSSLTSAIAPRIVARIDKSENINTTTVITDAYSGESPSSAFSTNGNDIWVSGSSFNGNGGVRFTTLGSTTSVALNAGLHGKQLDIFNNQLYVSAGTLSSVVVGTVGTGTPVSGTQTVTNLPGLPFNNSAAGGFFFVDLNAAIAGPDVLYVVDNGLFSGPDANTVTKYSLSAGTWIKNSAVTISGPIGITGTVSGNTVNLYITNTTNIYSLTDAAGYNAAISGTASSIATATNNTKFKGITFSPANVVTGTTEVNPVSAISMIKAYESSSQGIIVEWTSAKRLQTSLLLTDINGNILHEQKLQGITGINRSTIPVKTLAAGTYIITVATSEDRLSAKIVHR